MHWLAQVLCSGGHKGWRPHWYLGGGGGGGGGGGWSLWQGEMQALRKLEQLRFFPPSSIRLHHKGRGIVYTLNSCPFRTTLFNWSICHLKHAPEVERVCLMTELHGACMEATIGRQIAKGHAWNIGGFREPLTSSLHIINSSPISVPYQMQVALRAFKKTKFIS